MADIDARVRAQQEDLALAIDTDFDKGLGGGQASQNRHHHRFQFAAMAMSKRRVTKVLEGYGNSIGAMWLLIRGINPAIATPLRVGTRDMATQKPRTASS